MDEPGLGRGAGQDDGQREQGQRQQSADAEQRERGQPADGRVGPEPRGGEHAELDGGACRVAAGQAVGNRVAGQPGGDHGEPAPVRSASRCKAKLQVNEASSAASASANQAGFSVDRRGKAPSTAMRLGSARSMAAPATATTGVRLTTVFQVSGCACAALIAAAFAPTGASVPVPTGSSPRYCECVLAATSYFTP